MAAPMLTPDPSGVAGPGPGAQPLPSPPVPAVAAPPPVVGMPDMPGVPQIPLPSTHAVGPKGPNFDPTGTVPVAGSPADPNHPAQQAPPPPPVLPPATAEDAAARRYAADQKVADVDDQQAKQLSEDAKTSDAEAQKKTDLLKKQADETAAEDARQQAGLAKATAERDAMRQGVQNFKFHNFWDDKSTGQTILAGIGVLLGGLSRDPNHVNQASREIDNAISREWDAQKADLQRKMQLAQLKGEDVKELASQYAIDSGKLKLRQEQQLNAVANEIDALSARSKNQAGILAAQKVGAEARALAEQHGQQGVKDIAEAHSATLKDEETKAQTAKALAEAGKIGRRGAGGKSGKQLLKEESDAFSGTNKEIETARKEAEGTGAQGGPLKQLRAARAVVQRLDAVTAKVKAAEASKDPKAIKAAREELANETIKATEGAGPLLSGGKTTRFGGQIIDNSKTLVDHATETFGKFVGAKAAGDAFVRELRQFAAGVVEEKTGDLKGLRDASMSRALGEGGVAATDRSKKHYLASINKTLGLDEDPAAPAITPAQQKALGGGFKVLSP